MFSRFAGKRNTSRAVFTSHERALAKSNWATNSARLNRDSFLPFGSCGLCLEIAREPVSCQRGDIFCRECALANILTQKKELKRAEKARKNAELETAKAKAAEDEEDRERAIRDFELTQAGLSNGKANGNKQPTDEPKQVATGAPAIEGKKRKFELDAGELERIAKEDRAKARKAIEVEKVQYHVRHYIVTIYTANQLFFRPANLRFPLFGLHRSHQTLLMTTSFCHPTKRRSRWHLALHPPTTTTIPSLYSTSLLYSSTKNPIHPTRTSAERVLPAAKHYPTHPAPPWQ